MKKIGFLFATIIMAILFVISASALEPTGQCGDSVYWNYDSSTDKVIISGTDNMYNYNGGVESPFHNSDIKDAVIEYGVTRIGNCSFAGCVKLKSITIPDSVTSIGYDAFWNCASLKKITIPNSITNIDYQAFAYCSGLYDITLPDSITSIPIGSFHGCMNLRTVTIPDSITSIGENAFIYCNSINDVYYSGTIEQWETIVIGENNDKLAGAFIHCKDGDIKPEKPNLNFIERISEWFRKLFEKFFGWI